MRFAIDGTEKWIIWRSWPSGTWWCVAASRQGCPFTPALRFVTWREAMDYATGAS